LVAQRTHQLASLQELTRAVNTTLHMDQVLAATAHHTKQALKADAVAIWLLEPEVAGARQGARLVLQQGLENDAEVLQFICDQPATTRLQYIPLPMDLYAQCHFGGTFMRAPLRWQQRPIGIVGVIRWRGGF